MKRIEHPLDDLTKPEILRVRKGDIAATQKMMRRCALNLRELTSDGRNNLQSLHAVYLSQVGGVRFRQYQRPVSGTVYCRSRPGADIQTFRKRTFNV